MYKLYLLTTILLFGVSIHVLSNDGFERNEGQFIKPNGEWNKEVLFCFQKNGFKVTLRPDGFSYEVITNLTPPTKSTLSKFDENTKFNIHQERIDFKFPQTPSNIEASIQKNTTLQYYTSKGFFQSEIFEKVVYQNVLDGFDIEFIVRNNVFKYNIIKNKGADLNDFFLDIEMDGKLKSNQNELEFELSHTSFTEKIPYSFVEGTNDSRDVKYELDNSRVTFYSDNVNIEDKLIIDPEPDMVWSTFFGGNQYDFITDSSIGQGDTLYTVGITMSSNNISTSGAHQTSYQGDLDVCISKFLNSGDLIWSTYYAGPQSERSYSLFIDENNDLFVAGSTFSNVGFVTGGAHQSTVEGADDIFIVKMTSQGIREWGTYHGGNGHDFITDMHVENDSIYLVGHTTSSNNIATNGTHQTVYTANEAGHITLFDTDGQHLWGTYYGTEQNNSIEGVEISNERVFVTGRTNASNGISTLGTFQENLGGFTNAFISCFTKAGNQIWGSYFGGQYTDEGKDIALDTSGGAFIVGNASSDNNISTPGAHQEIRLSSEQGFIAHFDETGNRIWGSYTGGEGSDYVNKIKSNSNGSIIIGGNTTSTEQISSTDVYQEVIAGGYDAFIQRFNFDGTFEWGSYLGGQGDENLTSIALNKSNNLIVAGSTNQNDTIFGVGNSLNSTYNGGSLDGFIAYLCQDSDIPEIYSMNDSLTTVYADSYEWFLDAQPLNLFSQTINPPADGVYSVEVSSFGKCPVMSDTFYFSSNSLKNESKFHVELYPNPVVSTATLKTSTKSTVYVTDLTGRLITDYQCFNSLTIDFNGLNKGLYILIIDNGISRVKKSIVKM